MNKIFLSLLALSFSQLSLAAELDQGPVVKVNGRTYQLDPIEKIKFRPLKKTRFFTLLGAAEPIEFEGLPRVIDTNAFQTSIKNQGGRGSCTFFATSALIESLVKQEQNQEINISEEYFTWITKAKKGYFPKTEGSNALHNADAFESFGFMLEADLPFQPTFFAPGMPCAQYDQNDEKTPNFCYAHNGPSKELLKKALSPAAFELQTVKANSVEMVKSLAESRHGIVIGVPVHPKGWDKGEVSMTPEMMKECTDKPGYCGGHAVFVTGYDLDKKVFTFKNSWGPDWGFSGFGKISFDYIDQSNRDEYLTGAMKNSIVIPETLIFPREMIIQNVTSIVENDNFKVNVSTLLKRVGNQAFQMTIALVTKDEQGKDELLMTRAADGEDGKIYWLNKYTLTGNKTEQTRLSSFSFSVSDLDKDSLKGRTEVFARVTTYYVDDDGEKKVERKYVKVDFPL